MRGPRPPEPDRALPALSKAQAAVLQTVGSTPHAATLAELAQSTGLHVNTLREHLDALITLGLVRRESAAPSGRGRPAWRYSASGRQGSPVAEYAGLAAALASVLHRTSADPVADAVQAGTEWGHELARTAGSPADHGDVAARRQVVSLLGDMGFDPVVDVPVDPGHTTVRLTRCPLLDTAKRYPDVVCSVHLGIARGALREYDTDDSGTRLTPFAEPGACLLQLAEPERD